MSETISREATEAVNGFRLQKVRAVKLLLDSFETPEIDHVYVTIEHLEDVAQISTAEGETATYLEEDKNYTSTLTLNSHAVKNTLVSFFDVYVQWKLGGGIKLGFYTAAEIGKEQKNLAKDGSQPPPASPILELLVKGSELDSATLGYIHQVLVEEYKSQYEGKPTQGNLETLTELPESKLIEFLSIVDWSFSADDPDAVKDSVIKGMQEMSEFNHRHAGKEELIFASLMELIEERQSLPHLANRVVHRADVRLLLSKVESESNLQVEDPTWQSMLDEQAKIKDRRNLAEKIDEVCPSFDKKQLERLARIATRSKTEQQSAKRHFQSLRYRAFEACLELQSNNAQVIETEQEVLDHIDALTAAAVEAIAVLKEDYHYPVSNAIAINGVVADLFDQCFLDFEKNDDS